MKTSNQSISPVGEIEPPARSRRGTFLGIVAIFLLTLACHLPLLGSAPLAGTEGLRVIPAHDMVRTGDWLLIRLYGQLYLIKPPLHDWLIAISQIISRTGGSEFVWRLPSVVGAALLNAALYFFGARWFGRIGGIVSGICGLALLALWGQARTADVDSTNTTAAALTVLCLIELHFGRPTRRWPWIVGAGLALGTTLMTKGPAGVPLIIGELLYVIFRPGWLSRRRASCNGRATSNIVAEGGSPGASALGYYELSDAPPHGWIQGLRESLRVAISPTIWAPLVIGVALFGSYALAALWAVKHLKTPPDLSGLREAGATMFPTTLTQIGMSLLLPFQLFAFALPVSVALPLVFVRGFRTAIRESGQNDAGKRTNLTDAPRLSHLEISPSPGTPREGRGEGLSTSQIAAEIRKYPSPYPLPEYRERERNPNAIALVDALAGSVLVSWVVCVMSGMFNPRYGYVTLAPLCLLAGAIASSIPYQTKSIASVVRAIACGCAVVLLGGNLFIAAAAWKAGAGRPEMIVAGVLSLVVAAITFSLLSTKPSWTPAWGLVFLLILTAVPFAYQFRAERIEHSGYQAAGILRATIDPSAPLLAGEVLHSHPELFWYAGLNPQNCSTFFLPNPSHYSGGRWVVLDQDEYNRWSHIAPKRLSGWKRFVIHKDVGYVAWYAKAPAETQPVSR